MPFLWISFLEEKNICPGTPEPISASCTSSCGTVPTTFANTRHIKGSPRLTSPRLALYIVSTTNYSIMIVSLITKWREYFLQRWKRLSGVLAEVQLSTISSVSSISNKGIMKTDARRLQICLTVWNVLIRWYLSLILVDNEKKEALKKTFSTLKYCDLTNLPPMEIEFEKILCTWLSLQAIFTAYDTFRGFLSRQ